MSGFLSTGTADCLGAGTAKLPGERDPRPDYATTWMMPFIDGW